MLAHPILAVMTALTITTLLPSFQAMPTNQDLSTLCPVSDEGKFKCYSQTQYVLCQGARTVFQSMAAGVPCIDSTGPAPAPALAPVQSPTSLNTLSTPLPSLSIPPPSPSISTPASASLAARTSNAQNPYYDQIRHGTKTPKTVVCSKTIKVLGVSLEGLFRCIDSTHYVICKQKGPSDVFVVDWGFKCLATQDGEGGVVVV